MSNSEKKRKEKTPMGFKQKKRTTKYKTKKVDSSFELGSAGLKGEKVIKCYITMWRKRKGSGNNLVHLNPPTDKWTMDKHC